ncbi:FAD-dependent oxidoreductase [Ferruginivarius sediminum]|uniref:FAD-dependent oxidoreductase n=1 Tax=Ferruginivarius sediminum TaxID=2661937 RepID=A0A369T625_9PROT|nr:FAD-dependent oxidoreductase [Ferruginivarius sediminum]RDD60773.1 FAD-dependent oxidoreductase [Ferruginivarius sediminum]
MLVDFNDVQDEAIFDADVCVVGGGVAGITLARALKETGCEVCLLESGGFDFDHRTQSLYDGDVVGRTYHPLSESRLRFFGGTTAIWGGRCAPLDPIDFVQRPGIPDTGWPLTHADLAHYYRRAAEAFELPYRTFDESLWTELNTDPPKFDQNRVRTGFWQFDDAYWRFGIANSSDLTGAARVRVVVHANVVEIETDETAGHVTGLRLASLNGRRGRARARAYVLACGGIENARLLLASNRVAKNGLGNDHDIVGRYFMEHPRARIAKLELDDPATFWATFRKQFARGGRKLIPVLRLSEHVQRQAGVLNTAATVKFQRAPMRGVPISQAVYTTLRKHGTPNRAMRRLWRLYRQGNDALQAWGERPLRRTQLNRGIGSLYLIARAEQAPNPESRVLLTRERDTLDLPKVALDWQLSEVDGRTLRMLVETMDDELRRLRLGRAHPMDWLAESDVDWPVDPTIGRHPIGGYHHMGTTRMATDPRRGVVDVDARVHLVDNLYVAGSSVFPTSGWANPTMTIVALTLRLADSITAALKP